MPSAGLKELRELNAIRLDHDWTWAELSAAMAKAHVEISPRTLHHLIKGPAAGKPFDRTLHKVRLFLAHVRKRGPVAATNGRGA
jgi:hypothetical protein